MPDNDCHAFRFYKDIYFSPPAVNTEFTQHISSGKFVISQNPPVYFSIFFSVPCNGSVPFLNFSSTNITLEYIFMVCFPGKNPSPSNTVWWYAVNMSAFTLQY